ncbi:histidine kinase [Chitinophaga sedimenti]|nr:histidine kinase [Chitinophaga sedimenti]MCK7556044.1 histidine kinase [Chitinophaga sedimenti]
MFFLIHKNPHMASASLAKFSEMLRYQLYECNDKQILLEKEIGYLHNFIELEKLRQDEDVTVHCDMQPPAHPWLIAPFILMTFVENAFKHVSRHANHPNHIDIRLHTADDQLHFAVSNSSGGGLSGQVLHYGGIGLRNVKRRLDLLYPDQYELNITQTPDRFDVSLTMQLEAAVTTSTVNYLHHA